MTPKRWLNVRIQCRYELVNSVSDVLEDSGAEAVSISQHSESSDFEVTGLFESTSVDAGTVAQALSRQISEVDQECVTHEFFADRDWVTQSQRRFEPICISNRIWITAPWHQIDTKGVRQIVINPGMSFGTGHHATTRMCLEFLASMELEGKAIIDYGCGSGILAIAALVLGARHVYGIDIDPDAVEESQNNARINGVESRYTALAPSEIPDELTATVVTANLSRNVLIELNDELSRLTADSGMLALSGILSSQANEVRHMFSDRFEIQVTSEDEWVLLTGRKWRRATD